MNYGEILSKAWKIIWKFKVLWLFGLLASCGESSGGGSGNSNFNFNNNNFQNNGQSQQYDRFFEQFGRNPGQIFEQIPVWVWLAIGVGLILMVLIFAAVAAIGRAGLIRGALDADEGVEHLPLGELFSKAAPYFLRVFGLYFVLGIIGLIIGVVVAVVAILLAVATLGIGMLCLIPLICVLVPVGWAINIWIEQSTIAIVAENMGIFEAFGKGWELLRKHPGPLVIMSLVLNIGEGIVNFVISLPLLLALVPLIAGVAFGASTKNTTAMSTGVIIAIVFACLYMPVMLAFRSIIIAYVKTAWTLTYRRLTQQPVAVPPTPLDYQPPLEQAYPPAV
jgi:hypothetical protein